MSSTINASTASGGGLITSADASGILQLQTAGVTGLTIDASQNVGIGTSSPATKLELSTYNSTIIRLTNSGEANYRCEIQSLYANESFVLSGGSGYKLIAAEGYNAPNILKFYTANTEKMRIDASGNVGIGTSSGTSIAKLNISNASTSAVSNNVLLAVGNNDTSFLTLVKTGPNTAGAQVVCSIGVDYSTTYTDLTAIKFWRTSAAGGEIAFNTGVGANGTERMRIDGAGNLLVGTTSSSTKCAILNTSSNPTLDLTSTVIGNPVARFLSQVAGDVSRSVLNISKYDNNSTTSQIFAQFLINNFAGGSGQINANGANAAAFGAYSDSRLKENIIDLPPQLANIMALRPVEYDYIESEGGGHQIGFIAQEVQEIYPDLVGEREDGMFTLSDMNKNDARLIKAIQELKAIIDTQNDTINNLTTRLETLEGVV